MSRIEDFHEARNRANEACHEVYQLYRLAEGVGLTAMRNRLLSVYHEFDRSIGEMDAAMSGMIHDQYNEAVSEVGKTLRVLAGGKE